MSAKQLAKEYQDIVKYKKMKDKSVAISVEKVLERKRKLIDEAQSTIFPSLGGRNTKYTTSHLLELESRNKGQQ